MSKQAPAGWAMCRLGDALTLINGRAYKQPEMLSSGTPILRIQNLNGGENWFYSNLELPEDKYCVKGDLLYAWSATFGPYWSRWDYPVIYHYHIWKIKPSFCMTKEFAFYELLRITSDLKASAHGVAMPHITKAGMEDWQIFLPPLAEQKVIAEKLDTLLAQVETTKARLERIPEILKSFRQSVLTAAVTGKLTEEWRNSNTTEHVRNLVEQQTALKKGLLKVRGSNTWNSESELIALPANWAWIENYKLAVDQSNAICAGPFGTIFKAKDFRDEGVPIIFLRHVKEAGFNQEKPNYMDIDVWQELHQDYSVYGGELLVTKLGDPPGECCVYPTDIGVSMVTPDVLKMTVDEEIANKAYLRFFFNSPLSKKMVEDAAFGATRLRIDMALFKLFPVPLAPMEEQTEIVRRVEQLFAFADSIEQKANAALARVNNLTQSILAKAFRGELTADWRNTNPDLITGDNSAEALLAKIKAERAKLVKKTKAKA